jgi:hypothetical protein
MGSRRIAALLLVTGLTGCITAAEQATPIRPITCAAGADCDAKWSRAASWVALNPTWKIKTRTDQFIETTGHDTLPAFAVTKVATTPGNYEIIFTGDCANPFGCTPTGHNRGRDSKVSCSRNKAGSGASVPMDDYYGVAKRPNAPGALQRSDSHDRALTSIHRCASCCVTKPGMWSRLPSGHATRTYHPRADFSGRASNAGFELASFIIGSLSKHPGLTQCS